MSGSKQYKHVFLSEQDVVTMDLTNTLSTAYIHVGTRNEKISQDGSVTMLCMYNMAFISTAVLSLAPGSAGPMPDQKEFIHPVLQNMPKY